METTRFAVSADGTRIAYDVTGQGPFLMLLHGAGKVRRDWRKLGYVERLKSDFTVITVDLRGSGESDMRVNIEDYSIEKVCQDLEAVADACNARQFAVWGFSFGGNIARYLGAWSDRVKALAVIGVPLDRAVDHEFDQFIDEFVQKWGPPAEAYRAGGLGADQKKSVIKGRIPAWVACFQAMRQWPTLDPRDIRCPVLLLAGARNRHALTWIQSNKELLELANIRVEIVEGLDHMQEFTQVEQVYPVIHAFLKENL